MQARQLAGIGGNTPRTATARILAKLFEDSQGQKYSLYGPKGKRVFATLELFSVLQSEFKVFFLYYANGIIMDIGFLQQR